LRDDPELAFDRLADITCVDYMSFPEKKPGRFGVVYILHSLKSGRRLRVKVYLPADRPEIASATGLWKAAEWAEREVYDMYGVVFIGHPDLRRILMPDEYDGHPLRKDYPLRGRGERDAFPVYRADDGG
jgi:NADH/F420H2 dehydrogenase subunit C